MKIKQLYAPTRRLVEAFSIVEVTVAIGLLGMASAALLSCYTSGVFTMRMARENLRATQILLEKVETIRLYSYDQITNSGFIPASFTNYYDPNNVSKGVVYTGTMAISASGITNTYSNDLRMFTITLNWKTGNMQRQRQFQTFVARNGLQDYVF